MDEKQLALSWPSRPSYGGGDFVVGPCNLAAHELVTRWPDWPHFAVSLHGSAGSGKTHLARLWQQQSGAAVCDPAGVARRGPETLAAEGQRWVCEVDTARSPGDDAELALLHFHNLIRQAGGNLLLVSREPVSRMPVALADLRSRLAACPSIGIELPDDAMLIAVMRKLAADRQITLSDALVGYVMRHAERSFAAVAAMVAALDERALATGRPIGRKLAAEVLPDHGAPSDPAEKDESD